MVQLHLINNEMEEFHICASSSFSFFSLFQTPLILGFWWVLARGEHYHVRDLKGETMRI